MDAKSSKATLNYGTVVVKSMWWPGAFTFYNNGSQLLQSHKYFLNFLSIHSLLANTTLRIDHLCFSNNGCSLYCNSTDNCSFRTKSIKYSYSIDCCSHIKLAFGSTNSSSCLIPYTVANATTVLSLSLLLFAPKRF